MKTWWSDLIEEGKKVGYYVNQKKSQLKVKNNDMMNRASELFTDTGIQITSDGQCHLDPSIGSKSFHDKYVGEKVDEWCSEIAKLSEIAKPPYSTFIHGEVHKFTYFVQTIPDMDVYLKPLLSSA